MAKKEVRTDLWVYDLLKEADIELDPQGSSIKEIDDALKTACKQKLWKHGSIEGYQLLSGKRKGIVPDWILRKRENYIAPMPEFSGTAGWRCDQGEWRDVVRRKRP